MQSSGIIRFFGRCCGVAGRLSLGGGTISIVGIVWMIVQADLVVFTELAEVELSLDVFSVVVSPSESATADSLLRSIR